MGSIPYEKPIFFVESIFDLAGRADKEDKAWLSASCCDPSEGK